jgi:hypothetical protein
MDDKQQEAGQTSKKEPSGSGVAAQHTSEVDRERKIVALNAALERDLPRLFELERAA